MWGAAILTLVSECPVSPEAPEKRGWEYVFPQSKKGREVTFTTKDVLTPQSILVSVLTWTPATGKPGDTVPRCTGRQKPSHACAQRTTQMHGQEDGRWVVPGGAGGWGLRRHQAWLLATQALNQAPPLFPQGRSLSFKTFLVWVLISVYQGKTGFVLVRNIVFASQFNSKS